MLSGHVGLRGVCERQRDWGGPRFVSEESLTLRGLFTLPRGLGEGGGLAELEDAPLVEVVDLV